MNTPNHDREPSPDLEDALKSIYQSPAPNTAFVDGLEQRLRERGAALAGHDRQSAPDARINSLRRLAMFWQRSRAALVNVAALAALVMLVVALMALFSATKPTTTAPATSVPGGPRLLLHGSRLESSGPIGAIGQRTVSIEVRAPLPQVPDRVPLYDVRAALDQPSAELARSWAEKLGLTAVRLYQDTTVPEATYIAQADDGRFVRVGPGAQIMYQASVEALLVPGRPASTLDPRAAQAAAEAFLNGVSDLVVMEGNSTAKITFRVEASPQQMAETRALGLTFDYTVLIDGVPLVTRGAPNTISIDAEGRVRSAMLTPLRITSTGSEVSVQPADAVVRAFLDNDPAVLRGSSWSSILSDSANPLPSIYTREPVFAVGDNVTLKGGLQHWVAVDGGADRYFVWGAGAQSFILEGEDLNVSALSVEIKGRIAGQSPSGAWRIAVASIQPIEAGPQAYADWTGTFHRQPDGAWLETDSGQKYLLPDPPADLADSARVEVPGAVIDEGNGRLRLEWQIIYRAQPTAATGSGGTGSASAVLQQVIAPTPVVTSVVEAPISAAIPAPVDPNGAPYSTGVFQSITASAGETIITPTLPTWWTYQPGDEVTLEGLLSAQGYRILSTSPSVPSATPVPDQTVFEAYLLVTKDEGKPDETVPLTLVGDQVNLDLIRLGGLHVRVQGRLLNSDEAMQRYPNLTDKGLTGLTLEVTHFEQAWPDEKKEVYSGHIRIETLDGQEVAILSDTLSSQDYVLADSLTYTYTLEMDRQRAKNGETVHAIGVVVADKTFAGRPMLRLLETRSSSSNSEEALAALRAELADPVQDIGPAPDAPQDVIVDRVELAYVFQLPPERAPAGFTPSPIEVMYELTGRSLDGRFTVTYDLDATSPLAAPIEPPLIPPATPAPTEPGNPRTEVMTYTVQAGETIFGIAAKFHINAETILWANEEALAGNPNRLQVGMILTILPVNGLYYRWRTYDDLAQVAERFGVKAEDILNWPGNHLDAQNPAIQPGAMLIIPGGQPVLANSTAGSTGDLRLPWTADVKHCVLQDGGDHGTDRHEIDFDLNMEPVLAARDGVVIMADWDKTDAGGGYIIQIQHADGTVAVYQHLKSIDVKANDPVAQGQPIGVSGSTGKVIGPMLAFSVLSNSVEIPAIFAEMGHALKTGECVVSQNR